jgi:AcrR family transcriptional regulator
MPARATAALPAVVPTTGRRERRKQEVHDRIIDAAVGLFDARGVEGTKVDDICAAADVAQKTFFNHFPSKQHLVGEIASEFVDQLLAILDEAHRQGTTTRARLELFFMHVADQALAAGPMHRQLVMHVIRLLQDRHTDQEQSRRLHASMAALVRDGIRAGDVTRAHPAAVVTEMIVGAFYAVMLNWLGVDGYPLRARAVGAARFLGDALAP